MKINDAWLSTKKTFQKIGKKNILIGCSVLLIGVSIAVNWALFGQNAETSGYDYSASAGMSNENISSSGNISGTSEDVAKNEDDYFATSLVNRQRARDEAIEVLQGVVENASTDEEAKTKAMGEISQIALDMDNESKIETLVQAKGFEQCVAVISGGTASIIVKSNELIDNQISQINEIVYEQSGILPENIKIIQK